MRPSRKIGPRSRKGCPECRARKIKCDEARPECSQCLRNGRTCSIIDGLFRPHSLSIPDTSNTSGSPSHLTRPSGSAGSDRSPPINETPGAGLGSGGPTPAPGETLGAKRESTFSPPHSPNQRISRLPPPQERSTIDQISPAVVSLPRYPFGESSHQDGVEVTFFLRQFAALGGQWMDICTGEESHFSLNIAEFATRSPLIRYSACAMAAKQLGQMKNWDQAAGMTPRTIAVARTLLRSDLKWDFEWYGAKYYEKAIQLLAEELSTKPSAVESHSSPGNIYGTGSYISEEKSNQTSVSRTISACILCSYEELNATMRAWASHLDGVQRLMARYICSEPSTLFEVVDKGPGVEQSEEVCFWYLTLNDMLGGLVLHKRICKYVVRWTIWQRMGVPLQNDGQLTKERFSSSRVNILRTLVYVLCTVISNVNTHETDWTIAKRDLKTWYDFLPAGFNNPVTQHFPEHNEDQQNTLPAEVWFWSDTPAITMALYHMGKLLILVHEPPEEHQDILKAFNSRHRDLDHHARQILAIAHGMTGMVVRKYLVQPLYIAGRCLQTGNERIQVLILLRDIQESLGLATEYRVRELIDEFNIPFESLPRRSGNPEDVFIAYQ